MPIYAYRCAECGHELEALQKVFDAPLTECPACHRPALAKQVTAAGFQLKGSGWYVTDFRDGKAKKQEAAKTETPADSGAAKTDGQPAGVTGASPKPADATATPAPTPAPAPTPSSGS